MFGWLSTGRRIAMMEDDIGSLRALVADVRGDVRTGAALDRLGGRLADLSERTLGREDRLVTIEAAIADLKAHLAQIDARQGILERQLRAIGDDRSRALADADIRSEEIRRDIGLLQSRTIALGQDLKRQADDSATAVTALAKQLARGRAARDGG